MTEPPWADGPGPHQCECQFCDEEFLDEEQCIVEPPCGRCPVCCDCTEVGW